MDDDQDQSGKQGRGAKGRLARKTGLFAGLLVVALLGLATWVYWQNQAGVPKEAPEADTVLAAQRELPFQVLIPAYLPYGFDRKGLSVDANERGPAGEPAILLSYPARQGRAALALREWLPLNEDPAAAASSLSLTRAQVVRCRCQHSAASQCALTDMEIRVGALHIQLNASAPDLITTQQLQAILNTLGPAANRQMYSSMQDIPVVDALPAAVEIPLNAQGVQELMLVVTPQGYTPAHFAVRRGTPVRLTFRQVGEVGCGNELIFQISKEKSVDLKLASPDDAKTIEFTPTQSGDFSFHCPHKIYQGAMTVRDP
jgi:hypothetical protein